MTKTYMLELHEEELISIYRLITMQGMTGDDELMVDAVRRKIEELRRNE